MTYEIFVVPLPPFCNILIILMIEKAVVPRGSICGAAFFFVVTEHH